VAINPETKQAVYLANQEKIIKLAEKEAEIKKEIAAETKKINELLSKGEKITTSELNKLKLKLKINQENSKVTQKIGDIQSEITGDMDKEQLLAFDIKKNLAAQKNIEETILKLKSTGVNMSSKQLSSLTKRKATMDKMLNVQVDAASSAQASNQIQEKLLGTLGMSVSALGAMKDQAVLFGRALLTNPIIAVGAAIAAIVMYTIDMAKNTMTLSKELGISASQASKLNKEMGFLERKFLGFLGQDANAITKAIADNFGDLNRFTEMSVKDIAFFSMGLGTSGENVVKLAKGMESVLPSISNGAEAMDKMQYYAGLAKENGVGTGVVLEDLASNTELFAEFGKDGGDNLAKAAVQARKLGLSLETTGKIANSLLDFESSIEKEMEASLMIGKQLNYNKARELALEGDLAGAAADVVRQIGGKAELSKMNVLQRRALADSIGVSVEEMSKLASGKLDIKSDNVSPIDAQTEATKMLQQTTEDLRMTLLKIITPLAILADVITALAKKMGIKLPKIMGGPGKVPKTPNVKGPKTGGLDKAKAIKDSVIKTETGRFKPQGAKGPGFLKEADALKKVDDLAKTAGDDLLKVGGKASKFVKKVAVPLGLILDAVEVGTVVMDKTKSKTDVAKTVTEKAGGWAGAAGGASAGASLGGSAGLLVGPVGAAVGAAVGGLIGGIGGYFAGEALTGEVLDKTVGMSSGGESDKGVSKVLEEFSDLDKEERQELYTAMAGSQAQIQDFLKANSGMFSGFSEMGEMVQIMQEVAKNTGKSVTEIANMTRE